MRDKLTGVSIDVNASSYKGVKNSEFLYFCKNFDPRCEQLGKIVKYFAIKHRIIGTGLGHHFNSYTIVLMVIFFLQSKDILPSVASLQHDVPEDICEGANFAFNKERRWSSVNSQPVTELLLEFFQFYAEFDFSTAMVCPLTGSIVEKEEMFREDEVVVRDPFEVERNVGRYVSRVTREYLVSCYRRGGRVLSRIQGGKTSELWRLFEPPPPPLPPPPPTSPAPPPPPSPPQLPPYFQFHQQVTSTHLHMNVFMNETFSLPIPFPGSQYLAPQSLLGPVPSGFSQSLLGPVPVASLQYYYPAYYQPGQHWPLIAPLPIIPLTASHVRPQPLPPPTSRPPPAAHTSKKCKAPKDLKDCT